MVARLREMVSGPASTVLVLLMLVGCLFLWIGVPLAWLWIGSQVQGSASLGIALAVTMTGIVITMVAVLTVLGWLSRRHVALQERRRRPGVRPTVQSSALEVILVSSAGITVVCFAIWFFGFAGTSPLPLNIGY